MSKDDLTNLKQCSRCKVERSPGEFYRDRQKRDGLSSHCKPCQRERKKERLAKNGDAIRAWRREYSLKWRRANPDKLLSYKYKNRYGITKEDYDRMLEEQDGLCAICLEPETARWQGKGKVRLLSIDHDHQTDKVRGLLCHSCNRILGLLADDPERLRRALKYLEERS